MTYLVAEAAYSVDYNNNSTFEKKPEVLHRPASTNKFITGHLAIKWISDLSTQYTVIESDRVGGTSARLLDGDVLSLEDLLYGLMLPSGNDAAHCIARNVGQVMLDSDNGNGTEDPIDRFIEEMNKTVTDWGWQDAVIGSPSGYPDLTSRVNSYQLVDMIRKIALENYLMISIAGTIQHEARIFGPNARNVTFNHTIQPEGDVKFPEFISGKTGWIAGRGNLVFLWRHPEDNTVHASAIMSSAPQSQRFRDMRAVMNRVIYGPIEASDRLKIGGSRVLNVKAQGSSARLIKLGSQIVWDREQV